jgi:hypothetical protein
MPKSPASRKNGRHDRGRKQGIQRRGREGTRRDEKGREGTRRDEKGRGRAGARRADAKKGNTGAGQIQKRVVCHE